MIRTVHLTVFISILCQSLILAQNDLEGGLKFGYYLNNGFQVRQVVDGILIHSTEDGLDGFKIDFFVNKRISNKIDLSSEMSYSWNIGTSGPMIQMETTDLSRDSVDWLDSTTPFFNTLELHGSLKYRLHQFIHPYVGLGVIRLINFSKSKYTQLNEADFDEYQHEVRRMNYRANLISAVENGYGNLAFVYSFGLHFTYKCMILEVAYQRTLTPMNGEIKFNGETSLFNHSMDRTTITFGYRIFQRKSLIE